MEGFSVRRLRNDEVTFAYVVRSVQRLAQSYRMFCQLETVERSMVLSMEVDGLKYEIRLGPDMRFWVRKCGLVVDRGRVSDVAMYYGFMFRVCHCVETVVYRCMVLHGARMSTRRRCAICI